MKVSKTLYFAIFFALTAIFITSCDDSTGPTDEGTIPKPPTNLMAASVKLTWTPSVSETDSLFSSYVLTVSGINDFAPVTVPATSNWFVFKGLEEGVEYTFSFQAKNSLGELSSAKEIKWSPATQFTTDWKQLPIRIYESESSYESGLMVYNTNTFHPTTYKVENGANWTIGLYTKNDEIAIGSASKLDYNYGSTPGTAEIGNIYTGILSLEDTFESKALDQQSFSAKKIDLKQYSSNIAFVVRYHEAGSSKWTYAKVFVKYTNGSFLQGTASNRYVELQISHQLVPGIPYA